MSARSRSAVEVVQSGLVTSVRGLLAGSGSLDQKLHRIAGVLPLFLGHPDLLLPEQREPGREKYRQHVLHSEEDGSFSISSLVWLPGQMTSIHDHICWGVIGIHEGVAGEERFVLEEDERGAFLVPDGVDPLRFGDVTIAEPPGDIHLFANRSSEMTVSIHVYGTDVAKAGTTIRRRYDLPVHGRWAAVA